LLKRHVHLFIPTKTLDSSHGKVGNFRAILAPTPYSLAYALAYAIAYALAYALKNR
jgi:hypothetical protein